VLNADRQPRTFGRLGCAQTVVAEVTDQSTKRNRSVKRLTRAQDDNVVRYVAPSALSRVWLLAGMVYANRPWRLAAGMSKVMMAAFAAGPVRLAYPTIWQLSATMGPYFQELSSCTIRNSATACALGLSVVGPEAGRICSSALLTSTHRTRARIPLVELNRRLHRDVVPDPAATRGAARSSGSGLSRASLSLHDNAELHWSHQHYGGDPLADRETDLYRGEFVMSFVDKWDELIDWDARAESEGQFFVDVLRAHGKESVLDVATGTGFHSVRLTEAGFGVASVDGSAAMLAKAFENGRKRGLILKTVQADWRELNRAIHGKYDAIICLGNSFTHVHDEQDRRKALAEFYAALRHDGILILDQRNYDEMLDHGFRSKHKYYYCSDQVTAEPEYLDDGLARFRYSFPDGCEYTLNMFPLRKNYVRRLLREAGFERVRTYGDFQETYRDNEPDFFVHVAEKSRSKNGQRRQRPARSPDRRRRHSEESVPITADVKLGAHLNPIRVGTTEVAPRNGH
jgi:SAM-dependent methyltransferase